MATGKNKIKSGDRWTGIGGIRVGRNPLPFSAAIMPFFGFPFPHYELLTRTVMMELSDSYRVWNIRCSSMQSI